MEKSCYNTYYSISRVAQQEKKHSRERLECRDKIAGSKKGGRQMGQAGAKCSSYVEIIVLVLNFEFPTLASIVTFCGLSNV